MIKHRILFFILNDIATVYVSLILLLADIPIYIHLCPAELKIFSVSDVHAPKLRDELGKKTLFEFSIHNRHHTFELNPN